MDQILHHLTLDKYALGTRTPISLQHQLQAPLLHILDLVKLSFPEKEKKD